MNTTLANEIDKLLNDYYWACEYDGSSGYKTVEQAKQALLKRFEAVMLEVIGPEENDTREDGEIMRDSVMRNRLKEEQRQRLTAVLSGEAHTDNLSTGTGEV